MARLYWFQGCDAHLCSTIDFFVSPASAYAQHPPGALYALGFTATHQILNPGDGFGVVASGYEYDYDIVGVPRGGNWDDQLNLGPSCWAVMSHVFLTSGSCLDGTSYPGWTGSATAPTAASFRYRLGPAGRPYDATTAQFTQIRVLQLSLVDVTALPEPATSALVAGGLLALAGAARGRRRARERR